MTEGVGHPPLTGRRRHPLVQLTLVRYLEFIREPEAVFWVFIFPVLLAGGLGIAFRSRAPERAVVAVSASAPGAADLARTLRTDERLDVRLLDDSAAQRALSVGQVD